jgi:glycine hydroxymethyltransferase
MLSNHHLHNVAGLAVTLAEMLEYGKDYHAQVLKNAKVLAETLHGFGFKVLCEHKGFTESHQVVADITNFEQTVGLGGDIERLLEKAGIIINRNLLPWDITRDKRDYRNPGGIRLGVSELTRLGMKDSEMKAVAEFMKRVVVDRKDPVQVKQEVKEFRKDYQKVKFCFSEEMNAFDYVEFN